MGASEDVNQEIMSALRDNLGETLEEYLLPPPVFRTMEGEFVAFDPEAGVLKARFPVRNRYLNPYHAMQGGMVAAAVDNTLGPLSVLVAPPNVTRRLTMTYSRPVTLDLEYILVTASLEEQNGRRLSFRADVRDRAGNRLARAKAEHWILEEQESSAPGT